MTGCTPTRDHGKRNSSAEMPETVCDAGQMLSKCPKLVPQRAANSRPTTSCKQSHRLVARQRETMQKLDRFTHIQICDDLPTQTPEMAFVCPCKAILRAQKS
eukprot:2265167-Pleurochrysis_carterae.AAC.2